jgi:hypothetical protein
VHNKTSTDICCVRRFLHILKTFLIDASKEVGLEIKKTKYILLSRNAGQNRDIKIANILYENVSQFKYLGTTVRNQNLIQEEIKRILNSGNAFYHLIQNVLCSCLLSKNVEIRIYKTIILPVVLYGSETLSLALREEHRPRVFENRVQRIFGSRRDVLGGWRNCIMRSSVICTLRRV